MKIETFEVGGGARVTAYLQEKNEAVLRSDARPAVLIIPGGGYEFVSFPEGEPVAMAYAAKGYAPFVLTYSVKEKAVFPAPQRQALAAVALLRARAAELHIDPGKIAAVGFSAGGHVAAGAGVFWDDDKVNLLPDRAASRPDALVLVYPCITAGEYAYPGINTVHGKGTEFPDRLSLENFVGEKTPPAFLCHSAEDTCVPAMNSLLFATALLRSGVPCELHLFKEGSHGIGLATKAVSSPFLKTFDPPTQAKIRAACARFSCWLDKSAEFLDLVFYPEG